MSCKQERYVLSTSIPVGSEAFIHPFLPHIFFFDIYCMLRQCCVPGHSGRGDRRHSCSHGEFNLVGGQTFNVSCPNNDVILVDINYSEVEV